MVVFDRNVRLDEASEHGWEALNESLFLTRMFESLREQLGNSFGTYNFYIYSAHKGGGIPLSAPVAAPRKVLLSISDETGDIPAALQEDYLAIFKAYLPREVPDLNIYPLNIGYVKETPEFPVKPVDERSIDIFFSGNLNDNRFPIYSALHPVLRLVYGRISTSLLHRLKRPDLPAWLRRDFSTARPRTYLRFTDGFKQGLSADEYGRLLSESRIALCPKGFHSAETFRHMEALRAGCVVISEPLPDTWWYRNSPIQTVSDWRAGIRLARRLAGDGGRLRDLQAQSVEWWRNVCCEEATAAFIRRVLAGLEPGY